MLISSYINHLQLVGTQLFTQELGAQLGLPWPAMPPRVMGKNAPLTGLLTSPVDVSISALLE